MTVRKLDTWEVTCDRCGHTDVCHTNQNQFKTTLNKDDVPKGWAVLTQTIHGCGLTGYSREVRSMFCPKCKEGFIYE